MKAPVSDFTSMPAIKRTDPVSRDSPTRRKISSPMACPTLNTYGQLRKRETDCTGLFLEFPQNVILK